MAGCSTSYFSWQHCIQKFAQPLALLISRCAAAQAVRELIIGYYLLPLAPDHHIESTVVPQVGSGMYTVVPFF